FPKCPLFALRPLQALAHFVRPCPCSFCQLRERAAVSFEYRHRLSTAENCSFGDIAKAMAIGDEAGAIAAAKVKNRHLAAAPDRHRVSLASEPAADTPLRCSPMLSV